MPRHYTPRITIICALCANPFLIVPSRALKARFCSKACHYAGAEALAARLRRFTRHTNGCYLWAGRILIGGYGQVSFRGKQFLAHRAAYACFVGPIPDGHQVQHLCNVRACVRPDHLATGPAIENSRYMTNLGRSVAGGRHPNTKLTEQDVVAMRRDRLGGATLRELGLRYGVHVPTASAICTRRTWRHVP